MLRTKPEILIFLIWNEIRKKIPKFRQQLFVHSVCKFFYDLLQMKYELGIN